MITIVPTIEMGIAMAIMPIDRRDSQEGNIDDYGKYSAKNNIALDKLKRLIDNRSGHRPEKEL
ncbi:MAG: hypothetical protein MRK02_17370 [Candidatus Scalindua sp.]|nr:hypothetical protein [Candidatus Scalindua sp.]